MEFIERIDCKAVKWLLSQLSNEFIQKYVLEGEETRFNYTHVKKILLNYEKNNGIVKAFYRKTDKFGILRDYTNGVQALPTIFRGLIAKNMTDTDIVNAHPVIILNLCKKHNITCLYLEDYCTNRKAIIERGDTTKLDVIRSINKKQKMKGVKQWMISFDNEMKQIQQSFLLLPEYEPQRELAKTNAKNMEGAFMSHVATTYEVKILHTILQNIKIEVGVLMFDGFMFYGDKPVGFLDSLTALIKDKLNFDIQFSYKEHDNSLIIPDDWKDDDPILLYNTLKNKYEKDYALAYIENNVSYSYKVNQKINFYSSSDIVHHFETEYVGKITFWSLWVRDPTRQTFKDIGVYPHDVECPDGILNLWTGYDAAKLPISNADLSPILEHFKTLFKTELLYNHVLDWFANMLQYPSSQSIMMIWKCEEGAGKSVIVDFISFILGRNLVCEIQNAKEDLFGRFNGHLAGKVFLNINETSRQDMMPFIERIKSMITSPTINIEEKGQKMYVEDNKRHMLTTINPENVISIKEGSRRFSYIECCEDLIGNIEYFNFLYLWIAKKSNQRAFYQFLMERQVKQKLTIKDIPITEDMLKMYELNRDPVEDYCIEFTNEKTSMFNYECYKIFLTKNGLKYEISKKAFEMKFMKFAEKYNIIKSRSLLDGTIQTIYSKLMIENDANVE
jgi:hypothetical protein